MKLFCQLCAHFSFFARRIVRRRLSHRPGNPAITIHIVEEYEDGIADLASLDSIGHDLGPDLPPHATVVCQSCTKEYNIGALRAFSRIAQRGKIAPERLCSIPGNSIAGKEPNRLVAGNQVFCKGVPYGTPCPENGIVTLLRMRHSRIPEYSAKHRRSQLFTYGLQM